MTSTKKKPDVNPDLLGKPGPELENLFLKIVRFVKMRNASEFNSNLQFGFDLDACGLKLADLGPGDWDHTDPNYPRFIWHTPNNLSLIEDYKNKMTLVPGHLPRLAKPG